MNIKKKFCLYKAVLKSEYHRIKSVENTEYYLISELIRNTHSIEKGLCISNPRLGFGHDKQKQMLELIEKLKNSKDESAVEAISMALNALSKYLDFHKAKNYADEMISIISDFLSNHVYNIDDSFGGTIDLSISDFDFNVNDVEKLFLTRHSIRDFSNTTIDQEKLKKALILAQRAPSACNRQGYRVHILNEDQSKEYAKTLAGIGGFADQVKQFIMITGKISSYKIDETNQYIVSASMYAAYLTLTLHLYGIASCVIQRPVIYDDNWKRISSKLDISEDEQLICLLSIGNYNSKMVVPQS
ncbi:MAG TPA: nitroreductase family protein, partial [Gallicola sp.]|nr:nitroreductase family protein [Gallicola sp.]